MCLEEDIDHLIFYSLGMPFFEGFLSLTSSKDGRKKRQ